MHINKALDKQYEGDNLKALVRAPIEALEGIGPATAKVLEEVCGIKDIRSMQYFNEKVEKLSTDDLKKLTSIFKVNTKEELLALPFVNWAKAIVTLAPYERLNINGALDKEHEGKTLKALVKSSIEVLQGIGPAKKEALNAIGIKTIEDLANLNVAKLDDAQVAALGKALGGADTRDEINSHKYVEICRAITTLATVEAD